MQLAKLAAAYLSTCNPGNVIGSFRNAGLTFLVHTDRTPIAFVDVEQCHYLMHWFTTTESREFEIMLHETARLDEVAESEDLASVPIRSQLLEKEAARLTE
jgi:hypothetical protein